MITTVKSIAGLLAALKTAKGGDTILLAPGTYDAVAINNIKFKSTVTIASADPAHQAVLSNLSLTNSAYLTFSKLTVTTSTGTAATVSGSNHISFTQDTFSGAAAGSGNAMTLNSSDSITVTGSDFGKFGTGINLLTDSRLTISSNVFHDITGGDIRGTGVTSSTITGNTFSNADSSVANHADVINLWQNNAANHVVIDANIYGTTTGSTTSTSSGSTTAPPPVTTPPVTTTSGPQTVTVSSVDQLYAALKAAHAGDTIKLAAGTYDEVTLGGNFSGGAVTITSADPAHQAVFSNLSVSNASGLVIQQVNVTTVSGTAVTVAGSNHITFSQDTFVGTGAGNAMLVRSSDTVSITGSDFGKFGTGINVLTDSNLSVTNNVFHDITDGDIRGTGVTSSTISGNTFLNASSTVANHQDVLYLWQDNTANNVSISNNTFGATVTVAAPPPPPPPPPPVTSPTSGTHVTEVNSIQQLMTALSTAHAGDVITVDAGTYDGVALNGLNFTGGAVTITSTDAAHHAVFSNLDIENSTGLTFDHLDLTTSTGTAVLVQGSHAVTFSNDAFSSNDSNNAMFVRNSDTVSVTGSDVGHFGTGINILTDSGLTITNNTFHDISSNGVRGTDVTNSTISSNTFADVPSAPNLWQDNTANHVVMDNNVYATGTTQPASSTTTPPATTTTTTTTTTSSSTSSSTASSPPVTGADPSGVHTVTVSNTADLAAALASAHAGDTIKLAAGNYDMAGLYGYRFTSDVTITSADPTHQAVIHGIDAEYDTHLAFDHLTVAVDTNTTGITAKNLDHVSFSNMTIAGATGAMDGLGAMFRDDTNVSISNSDFGWLGSGVGQLDNNGLTISNNTFHDIEVDGVVGSGSSNVVVSGNYFTNFHPNMAWDHPDAIQFFADSDGTQSSNILIKDNVIVRGSGDPIQGIFIENTNHIEITGNAMSGVMMNGISLSNTDQALVSNNFLEAYLDQGTRIITRGGSVDVTLLNNIAATQNYTDSGVGPNINYSESGTTVPSQVAIGDLTDLNNWLSHHTASTASLSDPFFLH